MKINNSFKEKSLSGWGCAFYSNSKVYSPNSISEIQELIKSSKDERIIARGLGRSYGNPAQCKNGIVLDMNLLNHITLDIKSETIKAGGGASIDEILQIIVPKGFFIPVSAGTRYVTVAGAVAADIHGKNHHIDGSFGNHVTEIKIIDGLGNLKTLKPNSNTSNDYFWATTGGMGLTGIIYEVSFKLIPIETSLISVDTKRCNTLDELMNEMLENDKKYRYSVAWVDSLNKSGRGVITAGDHAKIKDLDFSQEKDKNLYYDPKAITSAPPIFPSGLLNKFTVSIFNEAWYRKAPKEKNNELQTISSYFHPLDGVKNWNKIYGPKGFLQYQFVIPDEASYLIKKTLYALKKVGAPSFLTVLKRFGDGNNGLLSFPMKGWTLAADVPIAVNGLFEVLDSLDDEVASSGGRLYLAKDSRQSSKTFRNTYPNIDNWIEIKNKLDPNGIFQSDLSRRIGL